MKNKISLSRSIRILLLSVTMLLGLIVWFFNTEYLSRDGVRVQKEYTHSYISILGKLVSRPLSQGDFILLDSYLDVDRFPKFVKSIRVLDSERTEVSYKERTQRVESCSSTNQYEFPIKSKVNGGLIGYFDVVTSTCELNDKTRNASLFLSAILFILLGFLFFLAGPVVKRTLKPLLKSIDKATGEETYDVGNLKTAPEEILPLLVKLQKLFEKEIDSKRKEESYKVARQIAHDIRSPLQALESLSNEFNEIEKSKRDILRKSIGRISDIANGLLNKSKMNQTTSDINIKSLIDSIVAERNTKLRNESIEIVAHIDQSDNFVLNGMESELYRALSNVINNSREAIPLGGKIEIDVKDNCITIKDNGPGIPDSVINKVLDEGFSTKENGNGLGLTYVKEVVEKLGGTLSIENSEVGASVALSFKKDSIVNHADHVLIDDDELVRMVWEMDAASKGMGLQTFSSIDSFMKEKDQFDKETAIFVDSNLGDNILGEKASEVIFQSGFENIHIATGFEPETIKKPEWVKTVRGKEPPFHQLYSGR